MGSGLGFITFLKEQPRIGALVGPMLFLRRFGVGKPPV